MRLLMYDWCSLTKFELFQEFTAEGIEFDLFNCSVNLDIRPKTNEESEKFMEKIERILKKKKYDAVFSINYVWEIAKVCNDMDMMYIAWTYDSPALGGPDTYLYCDTNRIFMFDSREVKINKRKNIPNLYHLNLAVNTSRLNGFKATGAQRQRFESDISFVGKLYDVELKKIMEILNPYAYGFVQAVIDMQMKNYGGNIIKDLITNQIIEFVTSEDLIERLADFNNRVGVPKDTFSVSAFQLFLHQAVANRERVMLLSLLSKHHQVTLYSPDKSEFFENIRYGGVVDYMKEMPYVFKCSKINLNITMRSIESGIPQRCIDVMGCHSFLLTNYQEDLFEEFKEGKSVVTYRSLEEAVDKADFYLRHDTLRNKIADNAYKIVKNNFSYRSQLSKIWKITGLK